MESMNTNNSKIASLCRIVVHGDLNDSWSNWLSEVSFQRIYQDLSSRHTVIISEVPDQAALRGLMNKIWDLNLTVISLKVQKYASNGEKNELQIHITSE